MGLAKKTVFGLNAHHFGQSMLHTMGPNGTQWDSMGLARISFSPILVTRNGTPTPFGTYNNIKVLVVVSVPVHTNIVLGARAPNGQ